MNDHKPATFAQRAKALRTGNGSQEPMPLLTIRAPASLQESLHCLALERGQEYAALIREVLQAVVDAHPSEVERGRDRIEGREVVKPKGKLSRFFPGGA